MAQQCECGNHDEPKRVIPVWLVVILFFCAIVPGIVALYCHRRLVACASCGHIRWQF